jgi:MSHA biogenesis protein MshN
MHKRVHPPTTTEQATRLYPQGYQALQRRQPEKAEALWLKALQIEPLHVKTREGLFALYLSQGRKEEAALLLEQGVARQADNMRFVMLLARLRAEQGDRGRALKLLEAAMRRGSAPADLFALSAALYQQQRDYEKSIAAYRRALQQQPQQATWWMGMGISLEGAARGEEAKSAYERALQRGGLSAKTRAYVEQRLALLQD